MSMHTQQRTFNALGSQIQFTLTTKKDYLETESLLDELERRVHDFERMCSRFLPLSELNILNSANGKITPISPLFKNILLQSKAMSVQTNGLFNPFILPTLQRVGYLHSFVKGSERVGVPDYRSYRNIPSIEQLNIGDDWARIPPESALDLGGCGKGYIGDQLADYLDKMPDFIKGYWLSIGGDVIACGFHETGQPISIYIASQNKSENIGTVSAKQRIGVATSTTLKRKGTNGTKKWHHIIDPSTGLPSKTDTIAATVCSQSLMLADIHASNFILLGSLRATSYFKNQAIDSAILQTKVGHNTGSIIYGKRISIPNFKQ